LTKIASFFQKIKQKFQQTHQTTQNHFLFVSQFPKNTKNRKFWKFSYFSIYFFKKRRAKLRLKEDAIQHNLPNKKKLLGFLVVFLVFNGLIGETAEFRAISAFLVNFQLKVFLFSFCN
jgi:hypothetical protein